jgi:hypothetical protein
LLQDGHHHCTDRLADYRAVSADGRPSCRSIRREAGGGWLCRRNDRAQFPVIEFWVENRLMCELLPPEFASEYLRIATRGPKSKDVA